MARNKYSEEFRDDAIRLYEASRDGSYKSVSADLGIARGTLKTWVYQARVARGQAPASSAAGAVAEVGEDDQSVGLEAENQALRSRNQHLEAEAQKLRTERDILRRATQYFAAETTW